VSTEPSQTPSEEQGGRERFATGALLVLAMLAAGALIWSTRGSAPAPEPAPAKASASPPNASAQLKRPELALPQPRAAKELLEGACPGATAPSCECRGQALERGFSLADPKLIAAMLLAAGQDASCAESPGFAGITAEALARTSDPKAPAAIASALSKAPGDAHALFAEAYQTLLSGNRDSVPAQLTKAEQAGRGAAVHALRGIWQLEQRKPNAAKESFERALTLDAEDVDALYNLAVLEVAQNGYNKPRARLLKVLKLRPDHLDARFALASLTHQAGASAEANRQQGLLEALAPTGDARVLSLRELMKAPSPAASARPSSNAPEFHMQKKSEIPSHSPVAR
jgi:tetratricopeptide (TPR) repeat protein